MHFQLISQEKAAQTEAATTLICMQRKKSVILCIKPAAAHILF